MKIQALAVIFVIIILPISIVLSEYVQIQMDTIKLQTQYDSQLLSSTYDAVTAFQKNTVNSNYSDLTSSKMRDIEASANVFLNSVANNFKMAGNTKDSIKEYIPAIVYTLYDGYYIYTPFTNTLGDIRVNEDSTYQDNTRIFGLKPYIYYSKEYTGNGYDVVITYSLDNYITVQGKVKENGGETKIINEGGYLIDLTSYDETNHEYRNVPIRSASDDEIWEYVDKDRQYKCVKVNGTKYYLDGDKVFYFIQNERQDLSTNTADEFKSKYFTNDYNSAQIYYENAKKFTNKLYNVYDLKELPIFTKGVNGTQNIEYYNSKFNEERRAVIKEAIEKNLSSAIANFSNISKTQNINFQMPKLQEDEWDKLLNNVSVITFLQGISMGTRPFNGYAIVTNNKNEESVGEETIYITTKNEAQGEYHRINDNDLLTDNNLELNQGIFNVNFERKAVDVLGDDDSTIEKNYYYPRKELACYSSIVNQTGLNPLINKGSNIPKTVYEYLDEIKESQRGRTIASLYYTALGRERQALFKINDNDMTDLVNPTLDSR